MLSFALAGCAAVGGLAGLGQDKPTQTRARCEQGENPLVRWRALRGSLPISQTLLSPEAPQPGLGGEISLVSPVAVAARANDVFIVDSAQRALIRVDMGLQTASVFARLPGITNQADLFLDDDLSLYLLDSSRAEVLQFAPGGTIVQRYTNTAELPQPIAVVANSVRGEVLVADSLRTQILVFNRLGGVVGSLGTRVDNRDRFDSVVAMARQRGQLYVLDRLAHQVLVFGLDGAYRDAFGQNDLTFPTAIAADTYGQIFVSDSADNTIKIFKANTLQAVAGGKDAPAGQRFVQISDLWVDGGLLYVADALKAEVQVLQIRPPCP